MFINQKISLIIIYSILVFIWATTPLAIVWTLQDIYPIWALIFRYICASVLCLMILFFLKERLPLDKLAIQSYLAGSLNIIIAQMLIYFSAPYLTSGLMVLLYGFSPLIAGLMGYFIFKTQKLSILQWVGMIFGVSGLVFIFADPTQTQVKPIGVGLLFASIIFYTCSIFLVKKIKAPVSAMAQTTGALFVSMLGSFLLVPFIWSELPQQIPQWKSLFGFFYTVIFSSIIAVFCYFWLIPRIKPSTFALSNIMTPMIALIVGSWLNNEVLTVKMLIGVCIAMSGIILYFYAEQKQTRLK